MNVDAVIRRLEALEGRITGTEHIESIIIGMPGSDGMPAPAPDDYTGEYVVLENRFFKVNRIWEYKPKITRIGNYTDYCPPQGFQNAVINLVRRTAIEISAYAREAVYEALQAVKTEQETDTPIKKGDSKQ